MAELNRCPNPECGAECTIRRCACSVAYGDDRTSLSSWYECSKRCGYHSPHAVRINDVPFSSSETEPAYWSSAVNADRLRVDAEAIRLHNAMPQPDREVSDEELLRTYERELTTFSDDGGRVAGLRAVLRLVRTAGATQKEEPKP